MHVTRRADAWYLPRLASGAKTAFALTDLVVLVCALVLAAGVLLGVGSCRKSNLGWLVNTMKQRDNLAAGAEMYAHDHRGLYPGQDFTGWHNSYTGSQVLAASLYGYIDSDNPDPFHRASDDDPGAESMFAAYREAYLATLNGKKNTLSDLFPDEMAFCYYPAQQQADAMFLEAHNKPYTGGRTGARFKQFTRDERTNQPFNPRAFLLIAPGTDRTYFTEDDIKNW